MVTFINQLVHSIITIITDNNDSRWKPENVLIDFYCCTVRFEDSLNIIHQQIHQSYIIY